MIEQGWEYLTNNFSEGTLITWGTLIAHEVFFFGSWAPFLLMDYIPYFQKYKIQQEKPNTWGGIWKCLKYLFFVHFVVQWGMMLIFRPVILWLGMVATPPLPSWKETLPILLVSLILEDFYFYWIHRFLHWGPMYKFIHKVHHEHAAPFGIAAEYAHPIESLMLGVGSLFGPMLLSRHVFTLWVWLLLRVFQTVEAHTGYDLPYSPTKIIPFWGGAIFHDYHHETFKGNYASTFTWCDWMFGTSKSYYDRKERRAKDALTSTPKSAKVAGKSVKLEKRKHA